MHPLDGDGADGRRDDGVSLPGFGFHRNGELDRGELLGRSDSTDAVGGASDGEHECPGGMVRRQLPAELWRRRSPRGRAPRRSRSSNSINPVPGFEANVAPFGLLQIDGEQFSYFAPIECRQHDAGQYVLQHPVRAERDHARGAFGRRNRGSAKRLQAQLSMAGDADAQQRRHHAQRQCWIFPRLECGQRGVCVPTGQRRWGPWDWVMGSELEDREPFLLGVAE